MTDPNPNSTGELQQLKAKVTIAASYWCGHCSYNHYVPSETLEALLDLIRQRDTEHASKLRDVLATKRIELDNRDVVFWHEVTTALNQIYGGDDE